MTDLHYLGSYNIFPDQSSFTFFRETIRDSDGQLCSLFSPDMVEAPIRLPARFSERWPLWTAMVISAYLWSRLSSRTVSSDMTSVCPGTALKPTTQSRTQVGGGADGIHPPWRLWGPTASKPAGARQSPSPRGPQARVAKARGSTLTLRPKNVFFGPTKHPNPKQGPPGAS